MNEKAGTEKSKKITCSLCSFIFDEQSSRSSCGGCFTGGCNMVKCPNCSYEIPIENIPAWMKSLFGFFGRPPTTSGGGTSSGRASGGAKT